MNQFSEKDIFDIKDDEQFNNIALRIFKYQAYNNNVYKDYLKYLNVSPNNISNIRDIPFIPISFFKTQTIITGDYIPVMTFKSSGTTNSNRSSHHIKDISLYEDSFLKAFEIFYGDIKDYVLLALLPSYLEREDSSLIYMIDRLIKNSGNKDSGFYLYNIAELASKLKELEANNRKTMLFGVSFALIDLVENYELKLNNTIVMETGGMKGMRKEITKIEMYEMLKLKLGVKSIHSEYSMTELLSQAYSKDEGKFITPPWMKVFIRDIYDPFTFIDKKKSGGINIIDLANINSCSFIETEDIGMINDDNSFEVLGRIDNSEVRGCNLLVI